MIPAPHPVLRRLYALGGVPGRVLAALESGQPVLDALSRGLDGLPLLSEAVLEALAHGLDLASLGAMLDRGPVPRSAGVGVESRGEQGRGVRPGAGAAGGERRTAGAPPPTTAMRSAGRVGLRSVPSPPQPGQVEAVLDRYTLGASGPPAGAEQQGRSLRRDGNRESPPPHRGSGSPMRPPGGAAPPDGKLERPTRQGGPPRDARQRIRRVDAAVVPSGALLRQAERAGSPEAAARPVGAIPAPPEIDAVLAESALGHQRTGVEPGGRPEMDADQKAERLEAAPLSGLPQVARAIARLERRRPRPARPDAEPALPPYGKADPAAAAKPAGPERSEPPVASPAPRGLRGLVQRLTSPDSASVMPDGPVPIRRQGAPDLLVEWMEDAMLADRIAAVLRREAARQGIDLEGAD